MNTHKEKPPPRDAGLDSLRGFLILLVVIGHLPLGTFLGMQLWWWGWLNETIYLFHVPLFFALSCLLGAGRGWRSTGRSVLMIFIPYVLWFAWQQHGLLTQHTLVWLQWLARGNFDALQGILWFLPALISVRLLAPLMHASLHRPAWLVAGAGAWLCLYSQLGWLTVRHASIPFGLDMAVLCLPYFAFVVVIDQHRGHLERIAPAAWLCFAVGIGFWMYMNEPLKTHTPWHKRIDLAQLSLPQTVGNYLVWCLVGIGWLLAFRKVTWRPLVLLGRHSLPIFLMHYEVFKWFMVDPARLPGGPGGFVLILILTLSITLPLGVSLLARRLWSGARWIGL